MTYSEAKQLIQQHYKTNQVCSDVENILVDKMLNDFDAYYICLMEYEGKVMLTDYAKTCHALYDIPELKWYAVCKKHKIEFNDWHIECEFKGLEDLENFIKVLDEVAVTE